MRCRFCANFTYLGGATCAHCGEPLPREEAGRSTSSGESSRRRAHRFPLTRARRIWTSAGVLGAVALTVVVGWMFAFKSWPLDFDGATGDPGMAGPTDPTFPDPDPESESPETTPTSSCTAGTQTVTDHLERTHDVWRCSTENPGLVFQEPRLESLTTGMLQGTENWFVCQRQVSDADGVEETWVYTRGDPPAFTDEGWGWFPATSVSSSWTSGPVPDLPACVFE